MMPQVPGWLVVLGGVPGIIAMAGALIGYGRIVQRLQRVELDVEGLKKVTETVARIDERTRGTDNNVQGLRTAVDRFVEIVLEGRAFDRPRRDRLPPGADAD